MGEGKKNPFTMRGGGGCLVTKRNSIKCPIINPPS